MAFLFFIFCFFLVKPVFAESSIKISGYSATSPEYVELRNTSSNDISLEGWSIKDDNNLDDDISLTSEDIIPANSTKQFANPTKSSWLNDDGDIIYLYDNSSNLIDKLSYPIPTPTKTPTPTLNPTQTPTPTLTPTPDSTIINPTSGISLTEFMPYSSIEWVEIYNSNSYPVKLSGWKLTDNSSNTKSLPDLTLSANGYATYDFSNLLNNDGDTIILINNSGQTVSQRIYENNKYSLDYSWSLINNSWCQASITKGYVNVTSCHTTPTATPTPTTTITPTPTPDQTKYTSADTATESAIIEPATESSFLETTPIPSPTSAVILENISQSTKKSYLPLLFIIGGGILLSSPAIINQIKKNRR